jgi:nitroreductase
MLKDLILANRSCRGYDRSRKVTDEELRDMIDCARLSASSINKQPLKYYIVNDEEKCDIVAAHVKLGGLLPQYHLPRKGFEPPAYIIICQDVRVSYSEIGFLRDIGIAAQSITLSAAEKGLAGCMIGNFIPEKVEQALGFDNTLKIRLIIAIGKSAETIRIVEIDEGESTNYFRDEDDVHYVPKRKLDDVIIKDEDLAR